MAPRHVTDFVQQLTPMAVEIGDRYGIDPALIITQAAIESGWGQDVSGNNYFGVKSHGQPGGQTITTHEEIDGKRVKVQDSFRVYDSLASSMEDYARFLSTNPRYGDVFKSRNLDDQVAAIASSGYATDSKYPGLLRDVSRMVKREMGPMPPAQIPNVVASQLDTQRPIPPLPQPRPQRAPQPQTMLPTLPPRNASPVGPGPTSLATVQDMYGRSQSKSDPVGMGPDFATMQDMYGGPVSRTDPIGPGPSKTFLEDMMGVTMGGVGKPPATRSVPSVPVRPQMDPIGALPSFGDFQSQMGMGIPGPAFGPKDQARLTPGIYPMAPGGPAVASAMSVIPPLPRSRPLRTLANVAMPTPMGQRPTLPAPQQPPLRVTVQGANSYNAPQPRYVSTTGQPLTPRQTMRYNPDTNTFAPVTLYEPQRQERRPSLPSGTAQSLV